MIFFKIVRASKCWKDGFNSISFIFLLFGETVWVIAFPIILRRYSGFIGLRIGDASTEGRLEALWLR